MHATNKRHAIDATELTRLYRDESWTMSRLAAHFAVGPTTIKRRLAEVGIAARRRGPQPRRSEHHPDGWQWSPVLAYVVGVIATDGNLSPDGRHLSLVSKDLDWLEVIRRCLGLTNSITTSRAHGKTYFRLQWGSRGFYDWMLTIGLTPAKSLTLRPLAIPDEFFPDFVRGCLDGDGSIVTYLDRYNLYKGKRYEHTRLFVQLTSASRPFLEWVLQTLRRLLGVRGTVLTQKRGIGRAALFSMKLSKKDALRVLRWLYYAPDVPCLNRKRQLALPFLPPEANEHSSQFT